MLERVALKILTKHFLNIFIQFSAKDGERRKRFPKMTTEKKAKAFFTLNLPRKPRHGDSISIIAKLRKNPTEWD